MPMLRYVDDDTGDCRDHTLRFPLESVAGNDRPVEGRMSESGRQALEAIESVSRRIDDLARELNCLGWFDDDDGPRAA